MQNVEMNRAILAFIIQPMYYPVIFVRPFIAGLTTGDVESRQDKPCIFILLCGELSL